MSQHLNQGITLSVILKNHQQSLLKIAEELQSVRSLSQRDEAIVMMNLGRLQGLGQGLDGVLFFLESKEPKEDSKMFGFALEQPTEDEELE